MKKIYLLIIASFILAFSLKAQITLNGSNHAAIGDIVNMGFSENTAIPVGSSGINQTWDLSGLTATDRDTIIFLDPSGVPGSSIFPTSNLVVVDDSSWTFVKSDATELSILGTYSIYGGFPDTTFNNWVWMEYPSTLGDKFQDILFQESNVINTSTFGVGIDSVRISFTMKYESTIDGSGVCVTPAGAWDAVRQEVLMNNYISADQFSNGAWTSISATAINVFGIDTGLESSSAMYRWWSNDVNAKFYIASIDTSGNFDDASYLDITPSAPPASIEEEVLIGNQVFPNPAVNSLTLKFNQPYGRAVLRTILGQKRADYLINKGNNPLNLEELENGYYLLELYDQNGLLLETKKVHLLK